MSSEPEYFVDTGTGKVPKPAPLGPTKNHNFWRNAYIACCVFCLLLTLVFILQRHATPPIFDERYYLEQAKDLVNSPDAEHWLKMNDTRGAGPVYALMHFALSFGKGHLPAPWFRLPNFLLLGLEVYLLGLCLRFLWPKHECVEAKAFTVFCIPITWVLTGMALTEMPSIVAVTLSIYCGLQLGAADANVSTRKFWLLAAGIAMGTGISVCGRQTAMVALPAIVLLASSTWRRTGIALAAMAVGFLPAIYLFRVWGGLVPQIDQWEGPSVTPLHAAYAFCYAGVLILLISPSFLRKHLRTLLPVSILFGIINWFTETIIISPLVSAQKYLPDLLTDVVSDKFVSIFFVAAGVCVPVSIVLEIWARKERVFTAFALGLLLLCGVCAGMPDQFSSRYVGFAMPFFVLMLLPWIRFDAWAFFRLFVGISAGIASLTSFYLFS